MIAGRIGVAFAAAFLVNATAACAERPALIVQITFDQLRGDLLERYRRAFTGGFKRVLDQGYWVRNGEAAHAITNSWPGHASLSTGLFPSRHGLTANEWWLQRDGKGVSVSVVRDERFPMPGSPAASGISPGAMRASTVGEWLQDADSTTKVVALGSNAVVAYGGRNPAAVYWYDGSAGAFVASTYYPQGHRWLSAFNRTLPGRPRTWALTVPPSFRSLARPDASPYEAGGKNNVFPHSYARESQPEGSGAPAPFGAWFGGTPLKDEALFELAGEAVEAERLGQRGATDYLALVADSTDASGHEFGPNSLEQLDTILRMDKALGRFLDQLDRRVGHGRYTVAISADHGVGDPPEEHGLHRITAAEIDALLDRTQAIVAAHKGNRSELADKIAADLRTSPLVGDAYTEAQLQAPSNDPNVILFQRSFLPGLTPDFPLWGSKDRDPHPAQYGVVVRFNEGLMFDRATAVHGSPYAPDRLVPVIFFGAGVRPGQAASGATTVDIAPTLARIAGIRAPSRLDGKVIEDAIRP